MFLGRFRKGISFILIMTLLAGSITPVRVYAEGEKDPSHSISSATMIEDHLPLLSTAQSDDCSARDDKEETASADYARDDKEETTSADDPRDDNEEATDADDIRDDQVVSADEVSTNVIPSEVEESDPSDPDPSIEKLRAMLDAEEENYGYVELADAPVAHPRRIEDDLSDPDMLLGISAVMADSEAAESAEGDAFPMPHVDVSDNEILSYLTDKYPDTRDQNPFGTCWAHSTIGLGEFYNINHGLSDKNVDYSELHMVYWCYSMRSDGVAGGSGDSMEYIGTGSNSKANFGGNLIFSAQALMHRIGYVDEEVVPYRDTASVNKGGSLAPETENSMNSSCLENAYMLSLSDRERTKATIVENGAVGVSIYASRSAYNSDNNSYYMPPEVRSGKTNHAVMIVGWDDELPAEFFASGLGDKYVPENGGGWLVRNSWSTVSKMDYNSYFWISYEDGCLTDTAWVFEMEKKEKNFEHEYYYDSQIHNFTRVKNTRASANIYTAAGLEGSKYEFLQSVAVNYCRIDTTDRDVRVTVKVYTDVDPSRGPASGNLYNTATTAKVLTAPGYYTIELNKPVPIARGSSFAVVVESDDKYTPCYERDLVTGTWPNALTTHVSASANQSWRQQDSSGTWKDFGTDPTYGGNFGIIAFTGIPEGYTPDWGDVIPEDRAGWEYPEETEGKLWAGDTGVLRYTGEAIEPELRVYMGTKLLRAGTDYSISFKNNINACPDPESCPVSIRPSAVIKGKGNFSGSATCYFPILPAGLSENSANILSLSAVTGGSPAEPDPYVWSVELGRALEKDKEYNVLPGDGEDLSVSGDHVYYVIGCGNFEGCLQGTIRVDTAGESIGIENASVTGLIKSFDCAPGEENVFVQKGLTVTMPNDTVLKEGRDYELLYAGNNTPGTAYVTVKGIGKYRGFIKLGYTIKAREIKKIKTDNSSILIRIYNGEPRTQTLRLYDGDIMLKEGVDFTVSYTDNVNAGKASFVIKGKGIYRGTKKGSFKIEPLDISVLKGSHADKTAPYEKKGARAGVSLSFNGIPLTEGTDYSLSYSGSKNVGSLRTVKVKGKGNFKGKLSFGFTVSKADMGSNCVITASDVVWKDKAGAFYSKPVLKDDYGSKLSAGKDYAKNYGYTYAEDCWLSNGTLRKSGDKVNDSDIISANFIKETGAVPINISVYAAGASYQGSITGQYRVGLADIAKAKVTVNGGTPYLFSGRAVCPGADELNVMIKDGNSYVYLDGYTSYEITGYSGNDRCGTATLTIKGTGVYCGQKTVKFKIKKRSLFFTGGY